MSPLLGYACTVIVFIVDADDEGISIRNTKSGGKNSIPWRFVFFNI